MSLNLLKVKEFVIHRIKEIFEFEITILYFSYFKVLHLISVTLNKRCLIN